MANGMCEVVRQVFEILPLRQRRQMIGLAIMATITAVLEVAGVISIVPFITVLSNQSAMQEGGLSTLYRLSRAKSDEEFLLYLGVLVLVALIAGNAFKAITSWALNRFTFVTGHTIGETLMRGYLGRGYEYFLGRHSADLGKNILSEVQQVTTGVIQPLLVIISRGIVAITMILLLFVADAVLAAAVMFVLGGSYGALFVLTRHYLSKIGQERFKANRDRFYTASEIFAGVKEVKFRGEEGRSVRRFATPSYRYAILQTANQTIGQIPKYGMEVIAFGGVLLITIHFITSGRQLNDALPLISLFVFAGYRIMPLLQEVYLSFAKLRFSQAALALLHRDMESAPVNFREWEDVEPLPFTESIKLRNLSYRYPTGERDAIKNISLEIPRGVRLGVIGSTGSGKSTLVDIIIGLLRPSSGEVVVDNLVLSSDELSRRWRMKIGYVPQHIFLADDTIAANIAFDEDGGKGDQERLEQVARIVQLHDFIVKELPNGYLTRIGEGGVRLSGGQRQRLGLARALYRSRMFLFLMKQRARSTAILKQKL
jgi:ABC-type bacteriocin/lantibiotic exporter with double-glycine peptidase domain